MKNRIILAAVALLFASISLYAEDAGTIFDKMINAMGGKSTYASMKNLTMEMSINQMGMDMPMKIYNKRDVGIRTEVTAQGKTIITVANFKNGCWTVNPFSGKSDAIDLPAEQCKAVTEQFNQLDNEYQKMKDDGATFLLKGQEEMDGKVCHVIQVTKKDGEEVDIYVDTKEYLPIMQKVKVEQEGVESIIENHMQDYKKVEGLNFPHTLKMMQDNNVLMTMKFTKFDPKTTIDDKLFDKPAAGGK